MEENSKPTYSPYLSLPWIVTVTVAIGVLWAVFVVGR